VQPLRQAQRAEQGELRPRLRPAGPEGVLPNTGRPRLPGARARKPRILRAAADGAGGAWDHSQGSRPVLLLRRERRAAEARSHPRRSLRAVWFRGAGRPHSRGAGGLRRRFLRGTPKAGAARGRRHRRGSERRLIRAPGRAPRRGNRGGSGKQRTDGGPTPRRAGHRARNSNR
ncbi:MAG: hypothetical protein AVDCRST_MAG88-895, partial [uncultured Thermomicrobiales bacterium]